MVKRRRKREKFSDWVEKRPKVYVTGKIDGRNKFLKVIGINELANAFVRLVSNLILMLNV